MINYVLLRGYAYLDSSLEGDVAVRRGIGRLLLKGEIIEQTFAKAWLEQFKPYRGLVAVHLWVQESLMGF